MQNRKAPIDGGVVLGGGENAVKIGKGLIFRRLNMIIMKKGVACLVLVCLLALVSNAAMLTDNKILSKPLTQGEFEVDAKVSYSSVSEIVSSVGANPEWISLSDAGIDSISLVEIPVNLTYGVSDAISLRLTLPYASMNSKVPAGTDSSGSGLANVEVAGLWNIVEESDKRPAVSALLDLRMGTGKEMADLSSGELYVGRRSTDLMLAGVVEKDFSILKGQALVGYSLTNPYKEDIGAGFEFDVNSPDKIVYSLALSSSVADFMSLSGELWGHHASGKETVAADGLSFDIPDSERTSVVFTPSATVSVFNGLTLNGAADLVLSKTAANTYDVYDGIKYNTYTLWGTYNI